jgi:lysozyme family protein
VPDAWTIAAKWILRPDVEGGYVNDPDDPGGETHFGISARAYPLLNIRALTYGDALKIYRRDYWDPIGLEALPPALGMAVFDGAVNSGPHQAVRLLQDTLGVRGDGTIGPDTIRAAMAAPNLLPHYLAERAFFYAHLINREKYLRGWFRRLFKLQDACGLVRL